MNTLLSIKNLSVEFNLKNKAFTVLSRLNLDVSEGDVVALVGESGSGKTMTAFSILNLLPEGARVVSGEILLRGQNILQMTERELRKIRGKEIGMIFQEPGAALNPVFSIGYQIAEPLMIHLKMNKNDAYERVGEIMREVGLDPSLARSYPHMLSGGQKQRAVIAMAISANPSLLIADEPTTALDVTVEAQIMDLFRKLKVERNLTIIFISHSIELVSTVAGRIVIFYCGRIMESGETENIIKDPRHPYTQGLMKSIPRKGLRRLDQIPGNVPPLWALPEGCKFKDRCPEADNQCDEEPELEIKGDGRWVRCWKR